MLHHESILKPGTHKLPHKQKMGYRWTLQRLSETKQAMHTSVRALVSTNTARHNRHVSTSTCHPKKNQISKNKSFDPVNTDPTGGCFVNQVDIKRFLYKKRALQFCISVLPRGVMLFTWPSTFSTSTAHKHSTGSTGRICQLIG